MAPLGLTQMSGAAAATLVTAAWEGLVLAGVVAVCLRMLPGISAAARSMVWLAVMAMVCGLPFVHLAGHAVSAGAGPVQLDERIGLALVGFWALISAVRAAQLVRSAVWLRGISRRAVRVEVSDRVAAELGDTSHGRRDEAASKMGHPSEDRAKNKYGDSGFARMTTSLLRERRAELCVSEEVDRPCVVGFFRPRVLVPSALLERLAEGELEQIVLHEMEHLRRGDDWTNLVQKLSLVAFPLNPALIWIERQLCLERELACDDRVLRATGARKAYAACLVNLAEHSLVRRGLTLALGAWERQSEVVRRVHRILAGSKDAMGRRQAAGVVAVLMAGVLAGADGLAHAPALVSFGPGTSTVAANGVLQGLKQDFVANVYGMTGTVPATKQDVSMISGPHATLVKAVMPIRPVATLRAKRRVASGEEVSKPMIDAVKRASNVGHPSEPGSLESEPMVVMVTWQMGSSPMLVQDSQFVYAAVPTGDGWMFVQL